MRDKLAELARRIGARIVQLRKHGGWNQQQFAVRAQISKAILSTIENGQRVPSLLLLRRLMGALGLPVDQPLIDGGDEALRGLWQEVYEGQSPVALQLRAGQDLKVQAVLEGEVVSADAAPSGGAVSFAVGSGGAGAFPDAGSVAAVTLAAGSEAARTQIVEQVAVQVAARVGEQLSQQLEAGLLAMGEAHAQALRNLTGMAHHLDRLEGRMEQLGTLLREQGEEVAALRTAVGQVRQVMGPGDSSQPQVSIQDLFKRIDEIQMNFAEYQKHARTLFLHNQNECQILRAEIAKMAPLNRR